MNTVKCKLIRFDVKYIEGDYERLSQVIARDISEWEELSINDYNTLREWVRERPEDYILVSQYGLIEVKKSIAEQKELQAKREEEGGGN